MEMTLTQAAFWTKRVFVGFIILIFLGTAAKVGYDIWYANYLAHLPKPEAKPDYKFGALPEIKFPNSNVSTSNFTYSIDTENGDLPVVPKLLKVYFIPQASITLLSPDRANRLAQSLGFFNGPQTVSDTEYHYQDNGEGTLVVNLPTGNFRFQRSASTSAQLLISPTPFLSPSPTVSLDDQNKFASDFRTYLASKNLLTDDLNNGRSSVVVNNLPTFPSQTFETSIWPSDIDKMPIVTYSNKKGLIKGVLTNLTNESDHFLEVDYTHWPIDTTTFATYPLKSSEQAFADLKAGLGFVSEEPNNPQVSIAKVYLAYFETAEYTPYLQPVFVFEGENFQALVPAIAAK